MTTLHYVEHAQHDIYERGVEVTKTHAKGKNAGHEYTTYDRSKPANQNDKLLVAKGEPYYWWQFAFGAKHISKERPPRTALTQSAFLQELWGIEDDLAALTTEDDLESCRDELVGRINDFADEQEEHRENMPEGLQDSDTGSLLEERAEALRDWATDLENVDVEVDADAIRSEAETEAEHEAGEKDAAEEDEDSDALEARIEELVAEKTDERKGEILEALQDCSCSAG